MRRPPDLEQRIFQVVVFVFLFLEVGQSPDPSANWFSQCLFGLGRVGSPQTLTVEKLFPHSCCSSHSLFELENARHTQKRERERETEHKKWEAEKHIFVVQNP